MTFLENQEEQNAWTEHLKQSGGFEGQTDEGD